MARICGNVCLWPKVDIGWPPRHTSVDASGIHMPLGRLPL